MSIDPQSGQFPRSSFARFIGEARNVHGRASYHNSSVLLNLRVIRNDDCCFLLLCRLGLVFSLSRYLRRIGDLGKKGLINRQNRDTI